MDYELVSLFSLHPLIWVGGSWLVFSVLFLWIYLLLRGKFSSSPFLSSAKLLPEEALSFYSLRQIHALISSLPMGSSPLFSPGKMVLSPKTGEILPLSLAKRREFFCKKNAFDKLVPWGSLAKREQAKIERAHPFSIAFSPLYVDEKKISILGWEPVPKTSLKLLVRYSL